VVGRARRDLAVSATTPELEFFMTLPPEVECPTMLTPEVEFRDSARVSDDPVWVLADAVVRGGARCARTPTGGASIGAGRLPLPGELDTELTTGSKGVYAPGSSVSGLPATSLTFALPRPRADDEEDLRLAGLDGTEADPARTGGDTGEDSADAGSGRAA